MFYDPLPRRHARLCCTSCTKVTDCALWYTYACMHACSAHAHAVLQAVNALGPPWTNLTAQLGLVANSTNQTGKLLQMYSQVPGLGPCYPVLFPNVRYFHRCAATGAAYAHLCAQRSSAWRVQSWSRWAVCPRPTPPNALAACC